MKVKELQDFLDYCDPNASIIIIDLENEKSHTLLDEDIYCLISEKLVRIDIV